MPKRLFKISRVSCCEQIYTYSAEVDPSSHILKGHFEGMPVVPGVCTLTMIKGCVADALGLESVAYSSIKECKFLSAIIPLEYRELTVRFELKGEKGVVAQVVASDKTMMKLKAEIA